MTDRAEFLEGERPEDVLVYLTNDALGDADALADLGEQVEDGVVLVVPGDEGRTALRGAVGVDPMAFAREAMDAEGQIAPDCTGGTCPAGEGEGHDARFVFAFAEARNEEAGGLYAEGDVIHAYARCTCGRSFSEKWVAGER